ncbi:MAG: hypothetical protein FJ206_14065 [Gemmatimonadetes bacterium]|nr:hypothetical protein [Gemmatimonadota bacterium]
MDQSSPLGVGRPRLLRDRAGRGPGAPARASADGPEGDIDRRSRASLDCQSARRDIRGAGRAGFRSQRCPRGRDGLEPRAGPQRGGPLGGPGRSRGGQGGGGFGPGAGATA